VEAFSYIVLLLNYPYCLTILLAALNQFLFKPSDVLFTIAGSSVFLRGLVFTSFITQLLFRFADHAREPAD
jgi:hypothetical protein